MGRQRRTDEGAAFLRYSALAAFTAMSSSRNGIMDTNSFGPSQRLVSSPISIGDRVRIARGPLAGLVGECTRILSDFRCVLRIDNWQAGVCVVVQMGVVRLEPRIEVLST